MVGLLKSAQSCRAHHHVKAIIAPVVMFAIMGDTIHSTGNYTTLGVNIPDFSHYSKSSQTQWWQAFHILAIFIVVAVLGIMTAAASEPLYRDVIWNPNKIVDNWRSHRGCVGTAFVSIGLVITQVGTNILWLLCFHTMGNLGQGHKLLEFQ
ncbi:hypothetical protein IW262DRAFT_1301814 [Armillaria fumosa]|nr:hypothetical protein IW262DRAFT_1301814 [Armillaria fumosa]